MGVSIARVTTDVRGDACDGVVSGGVVEIILPL